MKIKICTQRVKNKGGREVCHLTILDEAGVILAITAKRAERLAKKILKVCEKLEKGKK
jgi:hypothetical protein